MGCRYSFFPCNCLFSASISSCLLKLLLMLLVQLLHTSLPQAVLAQCKRSIREVLEIHRCNEARLTARVNPTIRGAMLRIARPADGRSSFLILEQPARHERTAYRGRVSGGCSCLPLEHCLFGQEPGWGDSRTPT